MSDDGYSIAILALRLVRTRRGFGLSAIERANTRDQGRPFKLPMLCEMPRKQALQAAHRLALGYVRDKVAESVQVFDEAGKPDGDLHIPLAPPSPSPPHVRRSMRIDVDRRGGHWRIQNFGHRGGSLGIDESLPGGRPAAIARAEEIALGAIGSKSFQKVTVRINGKHEATYEAKA